MYVTGRLPLLVALGAVPVVLLVSLGWTRGWRQRGGSALCAGAALVDAAAAPDPADVRRSSDGSPVACSSGEPRRGELVLHNSGSRTVRGRVRDAWQPTAGAPHGPLPIDLPPGESRRLALPLLPRRRGELSSQFVVVRSDGPLRLAGRQARLDALGAAAGPAAVHRAPAPAVAARPSA